VTMPSRGIGAVMDSKMPKAKTITRKDDPNKVEMFKGGGLYANIAAKKKRIAAGSGEKMRKVGAKGAPKKKDFAQAAKTASFKEGGSILLTKSQRALENTSSKNISPTERVFKPVKSDFNTKVMGGGSVNKFGKGLGGRASVTKKLSKDSEIEGYLEGFAAKPKGGPSIAELTGGGVKLTKRFAKGGESRVNEAGNYTKPGMRKALFERIKAGGKGGNPGQWSARKAQMLAQQYKKSGGGYRD
jgi:hypothetical protein